MKLGVTCYGPPHDKNDKPRETPKCVRCYHVRVACQSGVAPVDPPAAGAVEAEPPVLRTKRSADVAMDVDNPGPSKAAKPTSGSTAGSSVRISSSTVSAAVRPVDFTSLTPRPRRPRPIATSISVASSSSSVDNSDELLLAIRQVRDTVQATASDITTRVATFLTESYLALNVLEDRVRAG